jgi:ketosteroid isomerase-like protein
MTDTKAAVEEFFERYQAALLARDAAAVARMYAVPGLILFPGNAIAVTDRSQTEAFFATTWQQYEGIEEVDKDLVILAEAPGSVWVDLRWRYGSGRGERFCYQLFLTAAGYQIAVLTPLEFVAEIDARHRVCAWQLR